MIRRALSLMVVLAACSKAEAPDGGTVASGDSGEMTSADSGAPPPDSGALPPDAGQVMPSASARIGAAGGRLRVMSGPLAGAQLVVPAGAVTAETEFGIAPSPLDSPRGFARVTPAVRLLPDGATFAKPVTLTLPYTPAMFPANAGLGALRMRKVQTSGTETLWRPTKLDARGHTVSMKLASFSDLDGVIQSHAEIHDVRVVPPEINPGEEARILWVTELACTVSPSAEPSNQLRKESGRLGAAEHLLVRPGVTTEYTIDCPPYKAVVRVVVRDRPVPSVATNPDPIAIPPGAVRDLGPYLSADPERVMRGGMTELRVNVTPTLPGGVTTSGCVLIGVTQSGMVTRGAVILGMPERHTINETTRFRFECERGGMIYSSDIVTVHVLDGFEFQLADFHVTHENGRYYAVGSVEKGAQAGPVTVSLEPDGTAMPESFHVTFDVGADMKTRTAWARTASATDSADFDFPSIVSFTAMPSVVRANQQVTLTWSTLFFDSCTITPDGSAATPPESGSKTVRPAMTTVYELSCREGQEVKKAFAAVTVMGDAPDAGVPDSGMAGVTIRSFAPVARTILADGYDPRPDYGLDNTYLTWDVTGIRDCNLMGPGFNNTVVRGSGANARARVQASNAGGSNTMAFTLSCGTASATTSVRIDRSFKIRYVGETKDENGGQERYRLLFGLPDRNLYPQYRDATCTDGRMMTVAGTDFYIYPADMVSTLTYTCSSAMSGASDTYTWSGELRNNNTGMLARIYDVPALVTALAGQTRTIDVNAYYSTACTISPQLPAANLNLMQSGTSFVGTVTLPAPTAAETTYTFTCTGPMGSDTRTLVLRRAGG